MVGGAGAGDDGGAGMFLQYDGAHKSYKGVPRKGGPVPVDDSSPVAVGIKDDAEIGAISRYGLAD